jgi:hypothetical protein
MDRHHSTTARGRTGLVCAASFASAIVSMAASPAAAQSCDPIEGTLPSACGFVWDDANHNGIQDAGEHGLEGVQIFFDDGSDAVSTYTDSAGAYQFSFLSDGHYTVYIQTSTVGAGTVATASNAGSNDALDSDGVDDSFGNSTVTDVMVESGVTATLDFGFYTPALQQPGTGTPGYWKNHPEAWPQGSITIGGATYSKDAAIAWLNKVGKDKTTTMFSSLVSATLNVVIGNTDSCIASTITMANAWMAHYGPIGSKVAASSPAWAEGEPLHQQMDAYNNGLLCAPHRN